MLQDIDTACQAAGVWPDAVFPATPTITSVIRGL